MTLRERLQTLVRAPDYTPAGESELARRLALTKKQRNALDHEVQRLLKRGEFIRTRNGRIARPPAGGEPAGTHEPRKFFVPTRRGPTMPPPERALLVGNPKVPGGRDEPARPARAAQPKSGRISRPSPVVPEPRKPHARNETARPKPDPAPAETAPAPADEKPHALRPGELIGRIQFRAGGSAFVVRENVAGEAFEAALQVFGEDTGVALPGDRVIAREFAGRRGRRPGEKVGGVVRVLARERDSIVGDLRRGRRGFVVQPDDPRFSYEIHVSDPAGSGLKPAPKPGDKVVVKLGEWRRRQDPLTGRITARLGRTHEPRAELAGIFLKYDLATEFPADVEREAAAIPPKILTQDLKHRLDYRDKPVFTIDPDDAKDFDDALSYEVLQGGEVRVGIHIADVSAYVRPGSALDREARRRGNSTYLVGVVIPMLPEKLSNGLCSLVEAEDRLCKAVFLTFGPQGKLKDTGFANTVIRSRKRLTYKQAYALIFENSLARIRALPVPPKHQTGSTGRALGELAERELVDLQAWIRALWKIAERLRRERMAHGSLDLDMPETKIFVDEAGYADRLEKIEYDESHQLIEEFMLAANEAVARLTRSARLPSLYRVHDEPDPEKLAELRTLLGEHGIRTGELTNRAELVSLLKVLHKHPQGHTLRTQLLRSLKKAAYRHTPDGHYGLAKKDYTHFTSPIRRYADLVVHRVLEHHLARHGGRTGDGRGSRIETGGMERLGEHLSHTEINSTEAERDSVKVKLLEFFERELEKQPRTRFAAVITDVRANGFFIELIESMTFGFVAIRTLRNDSYSLSDDGTALVGRKRSHRFALNQRLDVIVAKVDRYKRLIDFMPIQ